MEADLLQTLDSILYNIDTESWENTSFDLYSALGFISNENEYRIYDTFDKFSNEYMHYNYYLADAEEIIVEKINQIIVYEKSITECYIAIDIKDDGYDDVILREDLRELSLLFKSVADKFCYFMYRASSKLMFSGFAFPFKPKIKTKTTESEMSERIREIYTFKVQYFSSEFFFFNMPMSRYYILSNINAEDFIGTIARDDEVYSPSIGLIMYDLAPDEFENKRMPKWQIIEKCKRIVKEIYGSEWCNCYVDNIDTKERLYKYEAYHYNFDLERKTIDWDMLEFKMSGDDEIEEFVLDDSEDIFEEDDENIDIPEDILDDPGALLNWLETQEES